jgi:hypothetical protein
MAFIFVEQGQDAVPSHVNQYGDALSGTPGGGEPILLTALNNAGLFALTVRNADSQNGRTLDVQKNDGSGSWVLVDKNGVILQGLILLQTPEPTDPGDGKTAIWAGTDGQIHVSTGGISQPINATNIADQFMLMGA